MKWKTVGLFTIDVVTVCIVIEAANELRDRVKFDCDYCT